MSEDKYRAALDMAAKQLSYRALSAKMLRDKLLAKGHDEEAADYALAWLTERSLLNDALLAKRLRGDVSDRKEVEKAVAALQRRGFAWNDIKHALETYGNSLPEEE